MNYKLQTLSSGLRVLLVPMKSSESTTVTIWVKTGSRNEEKRINGISHFLEHMVFKGSKKRSTAKEISQVVDSIGGEFNAATSKDWTNFYIKSRNAHLEKAVDVLSDMVLNPILKKEEIEREKGTIIQEIGMYEDTPMIKIGDVFEELLFEGNSLGSDIAGTPESVKLITRGDFESYRQKFYYPQNMLVTIAGGIDEKKSLELANKYFKSLKETTHVAKEGEIFSETQNFPQFKLRSKKADQAHFILGFRADGRNYKGRRAQSVLAAILGGGMSSRMFIEVRERRGLAYAVKTGIERYQDTGYVSTYIGTDPSKADEAIKISLNEYYKIAKKGSVTQSELKKAKEYIKGHLALSLEDTHDVSSFFGEQELFLSKVAKPEEVYEEIDKVRLSDVEFEAKRLFRKEKLNLSMIGSFKSGVAFEKLII